MLKLIRVFPAVFILFIVFAGCQKSDQVQAKPVWTDSVYLNTKFVIPGVPNRNETAIATLSLYSDKRLEYNIEVTNMASGDAITAVQLWHGNAGSNGQKWAEMIGNTNGNIISGSYQLTTDQADSLKSGENYLSLPSNQIKNGLLRGQIDNKVVFAADVIMNGNNELPPIVTTATGLATIRLTENKKLYVNVKVSNLEPGEVLSGSHMHAGTASISGPELLICYSNAAEFNTVKQFKVDDAFYTTMLSSPMYIHAFTVARSNLIRGQIR